MGSVKDAYIERLIHEIPYSDWQRLDELEATLTPPPTRDERADEAVWLLNKEREARWRKAQLEDSQSWREDEEFNRYGGWLPG